MQSLDPRSKSIVQLVEHAKRTLYSSVRNHIQDGDQFSFRNGGLISESNFDGPSHTGTAVWYRGDQRVLLCAESREGYGGRIVTLSSQVRNCPGCIDVYRPTHQCPHGIRQRAATLALSWAGHGYDYPGLIRRALMHSVPLRWFASQLGFKYDPTDMTLSERTERMVCSQLHAWAYRRAMYELGISCGWDPCPGLGDKWIEPAHLTRNGSYVLVAKGLVIA